MFRPCFAPRLCARIGARELRERGRDGGADEGDDKERGPQHVVLMIPSEVVPPLSYICSLPSVLLPAEHQVSEPDRSRGDELVPWAPTTAPYGLKAPRSVNDSRG